MGKWYYEDEIILVDPVSKLDTVIYIQAQGTASSDDFEIDDLVAYYGDGNKRELLTWQESEIEDWLMNNDELYQQAYERSVSDAYDRYKDRE